MGGKKPLLFLKLSDTTVSDANLGSDNISGGRDWVPDNWALIDNLIHITGVKSTFSWHDRADNMLNFFFSCLWHGLRKAGPIQATRKHFLALSLYTELIKQWQKGQDAS